MRYLVDAQLPPALARMLSSRGREAVHLLDLNMARATDGAIWDYAIAQEWIIITKDDDFIQRGHLVAPSPPIVWIRFGNTSKQALLDGFLNALPAIEKALTAGEKIVEVV